MATLRYVRKLFAYGSCDVTGQRGRGKDMLMGNIACRSKHYYSNINYGGNFSPLDFSVLDINNDYTNLVSGDVKQYIYPYRQGSDIYISDIGIYFPSQYCNELNKKYPRLPYFLALSRQLGDCNVHLNVQILNRAWDKFREQSDIYILCNWICKPLLRIGLCVQQITVYDNYESCLRRVIPFSVPPPPIFAKREVKQAYQLEKARYEQTYGKVVRKTLVYWNKSSYDTRHFKSVLEKEQA